MGAAGVKAQPLIQHEQPHKPASSVRASCNDWHRLFTLPNQCQELLRQLHDPNDLAS